MSLGVQSIDYTVKPTCVGSRLSVPGAVDTLVSLCGEHFARVASFRYRPICRDSYPDRYRSAVQIPQCSILAWPCNDVPGCLSAHTYPMSLGQVNFRALSPHHTDT
jgi:hypothetical protein